MRGWAGPCAEISEGEFAGEEPKVNGEGLALGPSDAGEIHGEETKTISNLTRTYLFQKELCIQSSLIV